MRLKLCYLVAGWPGIAVPSGSAQLPTNTRSSSPYHCHIISINTGKRSVLFLPRRSDDLGRMDMMDLCWILEIVWVSIVLSCLPFEVKVCSEQGVANIRMNLYSETGKFEMPLVEKDPSDPILNYSNHSAGIFSFATARSRDKRSSMHRFQPQSWSLHLFTLRKKRH